MSFVWLVLKINMKTSEGNTEEIVCLDIGNCVVLPDLLSGAHLFIVVLIEFPEKKV